MKSIKKFLVLQISLILFANFSFACGPCDPLSNVTQTINGTNLELTFTSNAGWPCCYIVQIEIVCANVDFSGTATHFSAELCLSNPLTGVPYPLTVINISNLCPGNYKWRAVECYGAYTPEFTFTVVGASLIVVNASLSEDTICLNENTQLTASASIGCNNGPFSYSWTPSVGLNNANIANPVATPSSTTTYQVTVTEDGSCATPQTASLTVTVNPLPTATISGTITVCQNENSPIITMTGADATGPYTISYTLNGNAQTAIIANNTSTLLVPTSTPGIYTYSLISVQESSSTQCINAQTGNAIVTVNALPVVNAGIDQVICAGTTVTLNGSNAITYIWNNGVSNGVVFTPLATNTYTVTGTDINGCTDTDQLIVTVNPLPSVNAGNDLTICENETVILTGSGANIYTWNNDVSNGISFSPPVGTTTYTVIGTDVNGCINTDQVIVLVNPLPIVSFLPDVTMGCIPLTVNFTNTTPNSSICVWTISNGAILTGCDTVTTTFTQAGCYDITLTTTSTDGCTSTFTAANLVCAETVPTAAFNVSSYFVNEFDGIVLFDNNSTDASNYVWNFGDESATSTTENPLHDYSESEIGDYLVTLIAYSPFGCSDTAYATIQMQEQVIYYVPNTFTPDNDNYNQIFKPIFTSGFDPFDYTLLIFNRWGDLIFESHNTEIGWDGSFGENKEVQLVQDGTYTWKIEFKTTQTDERIMAVGHVNLIR